MNKFERYTMLYNTKVSTRRCTCDTCNNRYKKLLLAEIGNVNVLDVEEY